MNTKFYLFFGTLLMLSGYFLSMVNDKKKDTIEIVPYNKQRDNDFISQRMDQDFPEDAQIYADLESEPLVVYIPIADEDKKLALEHMNIMGIPTTALKMDDKRWNTGIIAQVDAQIIFVATIADEPVAFIRAFVFDNFGTIAYLSTGEKYRGKGIAGKLLKHMISELKKRGIKKITLSTGNQNEAAQSLYKKAGFVAQAPTELSKAKGATIFVYQDDKLK